MSPAVDSISYVPRPREDDFDLRRRVLAEFGEMPGLRLTLAQAARLFDIEPARCRRVLERLVAAGSLETDGRMFRNARELD
jgi:hypothetical protein